MTCNPVQPVQNLPTAGTLAGNEGVVIVQNGKVVLTTADDIANLGGGGPSGNTDELSSSAYATLQDAINAAQSAGKILIISPQTYIITQTLDITNPLYIRFTQGALVQADPSFTQSSMLNINTSGDVQIDNANFDANNTAMPGSVFSLTSGIIQITGSGTTILNNPTVVNNATTSGIVIYPTGSNNPSVYINEAIINNILCYGIVNQSTGHVEIRGGSISNWGADGVYCTNSVFSYMDFLVDGVTIYNGSIASFPTSDGQVGNGVGCFNVSDPRVTNCHIHDVYFSNIRFSGTRSPHASNNLCERAGEVGLYVEFWNSDAVITGNTVAFSQYRQKDAATHSLGGTSIACVNLLMYKGRSAQISNNTIIGAQGCSIYAEGDCIISDNRCDGGQVGIILGTSGFSKDNKCVDNLIYDRWNPPWTASTGVFAGDCCTANGNDYVAVNSGTTAASGTGPSGTGMNISDGTLQWNYIGVHRILQYGILTSAGSSNQGTEYIEGNTCLDFTVQSISAYTFNSNYNPSSWPVGSSVFLRDNYPGLTTAQLPPSLSAQGGGSRVYLTDQGKYTQWNAVASAWEIVSPKAITVAANGNVGIQNASPKSTLDVGGNLLITQYSVPALASDYGLNIIAPGATFVRATNATYFDSSPTLQTATSGVLRSQTYNPNTQSFLGALIESKVTNLVRNVDTTGLVVGSPGTQPTNWSISTFFGINRTLSNSGTEGGLPCFDCNFAGTSTSASGSRITFEVGGTGITAATQGQVLTLDWYVREVAGSISGTTSATMGLKEYNSSGTFLQNTPGGLTITDATLTAANIAENKVSATFTIANAATAYVQPYFEADYGSGVTLNYTLRVGPPQLTIRSFSTSLVSISDAQTTKNQDVLSYTSISGSVINSAGTLFIECVCEGSETDGLHSVISLNDTSTNNNLYIGRNNTGGNGTLSVGFTGNSTAGLSYTGGNGSFPIGSTFRAVVTYQAGSQTLLATGGISATGSGANAFSSATQIQFGTSPADSTALSNESWCGYVTRWAYFPTVLSSAEQQRLIATGAAISGDATIQGNVFIGGDLNMNTPMTTLNGTTAGTIKYSQPLQGSASKEFTAIFTGYENNTTGNQTITYPTAFTAIPAIVGNNTTLTVSTSTSTLTIVAPNNTSTFNGTVIVKGA